MDNAIELDWPTLGTEMASKIVQHYEQYKHHGKKFKKIQEGQSMAKADFVDETQGAYQLKEWPEHMNFLHEIFAGHDINKSFLQYITLQRSVDELPPHTDTFRKMSIIYVVEGAADTVFYKQTDMSKNLVHARLFDKSDLTEINRYKFDLNKWYLINNSVIHGVDSYIGKRTSLLFDLTDIGVFENYQDAVARINQNKILFL
jgi:hypothetical protein